MALVGYSDSEDSDADDASKAKPDPAPPKLSDASSTKPSFQKVVDRSNPHKIRVSLPITTSAGDDAETNHNGEPPPRKRTRTSGVFSGFNSLLSAPKNDKITAATGKSSMASSTNRINPGRVPGVGVNLKTGATPSFSREPQLELEADYSNVDDTHHSASQSNDTFQYEVKPEHETVPKEVKLVGKATIFKPLSVSRKSIRRKKPQPEPVEASSTKPAPSTSSGDARASEAQAHNNRKQLFSTFEEDFSVFSDSPIHEQVIGFNGDVHTLGSSDNQDPEDVPQSDISKELVPEVNPPQHTLSSLAASLNLTPAQRRQLFGRDNKDVDHLADAQVSHFSLAAEYSNNNALRENESTAPAHNPVRSIASGKHSLQQLVSMASNQKDALEESFATGKANKKSAGRRYGW